jgi:hypothetical protein
MSLFNDVSANTWISVNFATGSSVKAKIILLPSSSWCLLRRFFQDSRPKTQNVGLQDHVNVRKISPEL